MANGVNAPEAMLKTLAAAMAVPISQNGEKAGAGREFENKIRR